MNRDRHGKRVAIGDFVRANPYRTLTDRAPVIARVLAINRGLVKIAWATLDECGGLHTDYFAVEDCEMVLGGGPADG